MNARAVALAALVLAVLVLTAGTHRRRQMQKRLQDQIYAVDRYVDARVRLHVVAKSATTTDPASLPRLRSHDFGGWIDTKSSPPKLSKNPPPDVRAGEPCNWYCSENQERAIMHPDSAPAGTLALGGMGAGKTTAGVIWTYLRWLEHIGTREEGGITAPTQTRLDLVLAELFKLYPASWYRYTSSEGVVTMCDGTTIRAVSTYRQSASQGSRIQGFNWSWWLGDEMQDQVDEWVNIHARLRSAKSGRAKRLATATAKDDPKWRTFVETLTSSGDWIAQSMLGPDSPFVAAEHWASMFRSMTERDYRRLVLAEDLPAESRVYSTFDRKRNVRPIPLGARKITSIVLSRKTGDRLHDSLAGHDPGAAKAGTVWLDAYELPGRKSDVVWYARAELFTLHKTHEQHATEAMKLTRDRFGCNVRRDAERAHVRCQPMGAAEDKPDLDVFAIWKRIGFDIRASQYSKSGQGVGSIKKESRIGVINTLFEKQRLFLECDDKGTCATPLLMAALETMERDHLGRPEHEEKVVKHDKSDLPAALGYALWPFEKELAIALRVEIQKGLTV